MHDTEARVSIDLQSRALPPLSSPTPTSDDSNTSSAWPGDETKEEKFMPTLHIRASHRTATARPIPAQRLANPREYEMNQLKRRFSPTVSEEDDATILVFKLVPSDPDFPFDLAALRTTLRIPRVYPSDSQPSIRIDNPEMERGYQINVERGFDDLVIRYPTKTLLALMNELDKNLESFLTSPKAKTIKLVANANKAPIQHHHVPEPVIAPKSDIVVPSTQVTYSAQQLQDARSKREAEGRQLEARLGRLSLFSKSPDGSHFNLPLQVPKSQRLPLSLQSIKDVQLKVPRLYPLETCSIRLREGSKDAELVELAFERHVRAKEHSGSTLMAHINYLSQNMHVMARETAVAEVEASITQKPVDLSGSEDKTTDKELPKLLDQDRPHVQLIPRPPEWNATHSDDEESDLSNSEFSETESEEGGAELVTQDAGLASGSERGILLTFPMLELYGIELLQISSLSIITKCHRCKDTIDVMNLQPTTSGDNVSRIVESCKKCASQLSLVYRSEPMHTNSIRAGFLDLDGCTVVDLLPSHFQPTCSECSTTFAKPGVVSVRGETSMAMCRECHKKMTFKLPEVRFLLVSSAERPNRPLPRKRVRENLGIVAGTQLPHKGRCQHYSKSFRWFRFSCCDRVYPCDRCHDAAEQHPNEHANRMLCGFCSKEQNYRPEDCSFCHIVLVGKRRGGFWEGGKGTRDKTKMSRKDPRKYKRRGGGAVSAKAK
jgi:uncharacterized CHY-type Zn-finger protein